MSRQVMTRMYARFLSVLICPKDLLEKNESQPPSFSVHLHPEHWTLNNVSKFLYNTQISVGDSRSALC
jgi:hypothetical protein